MNQSSVSINNKVSVWNKFVWYGKQPVKVSIQRSNKMVSLAYLFSCHTAEAWNVSVLNLSNSQISVLFFCFGNILFYITLSGISFRWYVTKDMSWCLTNWVHTVLKRGEKIFTLHTNHKKYKNMFVGRIICIH